MSRQREGWAEPRLAANYSPALEQLLGREPSVVDAVKVSEFDGPELMTSYRHQKAVKALILHGLGGPARPAPGDPAFRRAFRPDALLAAIRITDADHLSIHLERVGGWEEAFCARAFLQRLAEDVDHIRQLTRLPVRLENVHFYRSRGGSADVHPASCDPEFVAAALAVTGCEMLLDLAHAQLAAWHREETADAYLNRLPLPLVREVHISGPVMVGGELRDRHEEIGPEGYALLEWVLARAPVETVTLEYGGVGALFASRSDPAVLERQLLRLRRLLAQE